jgi:iron complex outermembrane receptor protein
MRRLVRPILPPLCILCIAAPAVLSAQARDTVRVDSTRVAREYDLRGLTVNVARPALTTGGSSMVVVRLDSLGSMPTPSMEQVIRAMPLVVVRRNSRGEAQPTIRGSDERQIGVFMDGVPLTIGWDHRTDMSIIPLTAAQSVRLIRGLSSVLYGPNTMGGIIEVDVARVPGRVESVNPLTLGMSLDETGGTNLSVNVARLVERDDSQWLVRAGAGFEDRQGITIPGGARSDVRMRQRFLIDADNRRLNSDSRRVDGFFGARYRADGGAWASLVTSALDAERGVQPEAHQDEPRLWRYPNQSRLFTALSVGTGIRETGGGGTGDLEMSVGLDLGSTRIDQYDTESFSKVVGSEDSDDRTVTVRVEGDHTMGERGDIRAAATYADVAHDEVLTPGGANRFRQRLWSLGVESEWKLGSSGGTRLSVGTVLDGSDTPVSGDKPPLGGLTDYGLRLGMSSLVSDGLLLHGSVSRRARFPSLRELYSGALGRFEPNSDLRPETLVGAEGGFTLQRTGNIEFQVVGFHQRLSDGIVRTSVTGEDGMRRFRRLNQEQVRSTGIELVAIGALGVATVSSDLTLQRVKGMDADGGEVQLEYEPAITGKLRLETPLGAGFRVSGNFRFVGGQSCENPEVGGLQPLGASGSADFTLRKIFQLRSAGRLSRVDASASLRNASDATVYDQCGLPQPGRTLQFQFRLW